LAHELGRLDDGLIVRVQRGTPLLVPVGPGSMEFRIQNDGRMQPLDPQPALIDRAYERLVEAIADGTLAPGRRIRQEELGRMLGVSRQPVSHALQLLKQQRLVENGRRGLVVSTIDAVAIRELYQVRTALDALAARLAAERVADRVIDLSQRRAARRALAEGLKLRPDAPVLAFIQADVAFHTAVYRLSGNRGIEDTVAAQWPHFKRSMGAVLDDPEQRPLVWREHEEIMRLVLAGDAAGAESTARRHTDRAGSETARRLAQSAGSREGDRDGTYCAAAPGIR
jgi:DNA-binding GntR family transcriptional regulator